MEQGNIGGISELNEEQKDRLRMLANNKEMEKFSDLLAVSRFTREGIKEKYNDGSTEKFNGREISRHKYFFEEVKRRLQQIGIISKLVGKFKLEETRAQSAVAAAFEPVSFIPVIGGAVASVAADAGKSAVGAKRQGRLINASRVVDEIQELTGLDSDLFYEAFALYLTESLVDELSSFTPHKGGLARKSTTTKINDLISEEISQIKKFLAGNDVRTLFKKGERVDGVEVIRRIVERVAHLGEENKRSLRYKASERFKEKIERKEGGKKGRGTFKPKQARIEPVLETGLELRKLLMEKKEKTRVERFLLDQQGKVIKAFVISETQKEVKALKKRQEDSERKAEESEREAEKDRRKAEESEREAEKDRRKAAESEREAAKDREKAAEDRRKAAEAEAELGRRQEELERKAAKDKKEIEERLKKAEAKVREVKALAEVGSDFRELLEEALNATSKELETGKKEKKESKSLASEKFNVVTKTENGKIVFEITHPDPKKLEEFADGFNNWSESKDVRIEAVKPNGRQAIVIKVQDKSLLQRIINFILSLLGKEIKEKKKIVMQLKLEEKVKVLSVVKESANKQQAQQKKGEHSQLEGQDADDKSEVVKSHTR